MDILDDMGASKLSAKVFLKVNYSFNNKRAVVARNVKYSDVSSITIQLLTTYQNQLFTCDNHHHNMGDPVAIFA